MGFKSSGPIMVLPAPNFSPHPEDQVVVIAEIATALGLELRVEVRLEELAKGARECQV